jgi:HSP20 family molecular chaperone IbpA
MLTQLMEQHLRMVFSLRFVETDSKYYLRFPVPGIPDKNYNLWIDNGQLTIVAKKNLPLADKMTAKAKKKVNDSSAYHQFSIPPDLAEDECDFRVADGILLVSFAKERDAEEPPADDTYH